LPLKTDKGDFRGLLNGTVNFTMTPEQKQHLQAQARQAVSTHLETRGKTREQHGFASLDEAVLAMDDQLLAGVAAELKKDPAAARVLMFRRARNRRCTPWTWRLPRPIRPAGADDHAENRLCAA
jgi:exoenzyme U